jgi:hypothetical protein
MVMREEVYELEDPVEVSGNKVSIVRLKRPDFDLICELGLPADCSSQQEQLKLLREYVIRLSGLPKETVGRFGVADSMELVSKVGSFFTRSDSATRKRP